MWEKGDRQHTATVLDRLANALRSGVREAREMRAKAIQQWKKRQVLRGAWAAMTENRLIGDPRAFVPRHQRVPWRKLTAATGGRTAETARRL